MKTKKSVIIMSKSTCIYCNSTGPFSDEHALPACLGEFRGFPLLQNRICSECNNRKIGNCEQQFCRCGPEAFFRTFFGVEGREHHDKVNVYRRGSFGGKPIDFIGIHPTLGIPILYEKISGTDKVGIVSQIVIKDEHGNTFPIRLQKRMKSTEDVRSEIKKIIQGKIIEMRVLPDDDEVEWVKEPLKGFGGDFKWEEPLEIHSISNPVAEVKVSTPYFRAVAKIGFHYFLSTCDKVNGSETEFDEIRDFIIAGVERGQFVTQEDTSLLLAPPNAVPSRRSHILTAEVFKGSLSARMQFFIGPGFVPLTYRVLLSKTPRLTPSDFASGHIFAYFEDGKQGKFSGEVFALDVMRVSEH